MSVIVYMDETGDHSLELVDKDFPFVAECRGKNEDDALMLSFLKVTSQGTGYIDAQRFKAITFDLKFVPKARNVVGTQLADLAAYPIARHVHNTQRPNPAYDISEPKFYNGPGWVRGLEIFP